MLLVDDNEYNLYALRIMLEMFGIQSDFANNGEKAIEMVEAERCCGYRCILMDLDMPVMGGYEATGILLHMIKAREIDPIDIIAVTANGQDSIRSKCLKHGFTAFIEKPIFLDILVSHLKKYFKKNFFLLPKE